MRNKKFPSIFAYSANTVGLRSLWHLDELFLTKFPLKWCIVCICSLSGSRNIYKNVFSVKLQFSWICNFFHEKQLVKQQQVIFRDGGQEKMWFYCNFFGGSIHKKLHSNHIFSWSPSRKMMCRHLTSFFSFFFMKKVTNSRKLQFEGKYIFIDILGPK